MKLYRYMSTFEFSRYVSGEIMKHENIYTKINSLENYPFHFLASETIFTDTNNNRRVFTPMDCYTFLMGIVSSHLLVCIDFPEETYRKSENVQYADPYGSDEEIILITEYQVDTYNINDNKLIKFAIINEYIYKDTARFDFIWVSDMKITNSNPFKFGRLKD